jgi:hypothetical protein
LIMKKKIRIGSGAGFQQDRIDPAVELVEKGDIQYLVFECLAERTIATAQQSRRQDPSLGYDMLIEARMEAVLPMCCEKKIKIITNMGAANPVGGMRKVVEVAQKLGIRGMKIAAVTGDDVLETILKGDCIIEETGDKVSTLNKLISANVYLGAEPIVEALINGADVIITGRVADPAMYMAPLIYEFNWPMDNYDLLGKGILVGHLLECAGQVTGGYFAEPGYKDVPDLAHLGFPIAEVQEDGTAVITKVEGSGGKVTLDTCKEQLLYEIMDPSSYITPDVIADFTGVTLTQIGDDQVMVQGGCGRQKPAMLKVSVGYLDSFVGEGRFSYAGSGAVARGKLALEIVAERLKMSGIKYLETRFDLVGVNALHGPLSAVHENAYEVQIRVAARVTNILDALHTGAEVITLGTNGPAGGGGGSVNVWEVLAIVSTFIPRSLVNARVILEEI